MDLISYILNKNAIAKVEVDVEEVKEDLSKAEQDIVDIKEDIVGIKEDITQDEQDISDIKGDITDIKEDIGQDEQDISDIKGDITTIQGDISDINTELAKKVNEDDLGTSAYLDVPEEGHDAAAGEVVVGSDSRLSDSRDPNPHTHTLANITDAGSAAAYDIPVMGDALADEVVMGDDSRLTDTRDPNPHTHDLSDITDAGTAASKNVAASGDAATTEVVMGNDSRLTDSRDPNPHTHEVADITDFPSLGTASAKNVPSSGDAGNDEVVLGNDSRLSDARPSSDVTNTYSSSGTVPVSGKAVAAALGTLDVSSVGGNNKYISEISETDGKISATAGTIDTTVTKDSTNIVTSGAVWAAIDNLPEPMVFRGSLGSGGTISVLPVDGSATVGDTYKVITDGTYAGQDAKVGDLFSCLTRTSSANTWEYFPSGDEPSGTVISVKIEASSPIVVDDDSAITTSGTRVLSHANSGVTAGTYTSITVDAKGHVTDGSNPDISYNDLVDKPTLGTAAALNVPASGNASSGQVVKGDDSRLTDARNAADVYAWAKEENKPSYTKSEVGLGNVDNTSDADKPISTATQTALNNKVDKIDGKGLSTNDFTNTEKNKLAGIESGAEVNIQADWNEDDNTSDAFINNKPASMPASDVYSWAKAANKPSYTASEVGAVPTYVAGGTNNITALQSLFQDHNIAKSVGVSARLEHGSHSMAFGWFLDGYDYNHTYGGWFISDYATPSWVGVQNGEWTDNKYFAFKDEIPSLDPIVHVNSDIPEGAGNLSNTATVHRITAYRNGLTIPYQMDDTNDGGFIRVRGTTENNCIFEMGTWDDSGSGETIQFNYYPTTSQVTPTYSVIVPKKSGTIALTSDIPDISGKLDKTGGTLTGELISQDGGIWIQGGSAAGGNYNRLITVSGMPEGMGYNQGKRGTRLYSNGIAFLDPYNGNDNNDSAWIRHIEETTNTGILEIAVGDDGANEVVAVRRYNTSNNVANEILLFDKNGYTIYGTSIAINPNQGGNYNEGLRINKASNGWSTLTMGGATGSVTGTGDNVWFLGCNASGYNHRFMIGHNSGGDSGTYWYVDSSSQTSPYLKVGGDIHADRYIYANYFNQSSGAETPTTDSYWFYCNSDGFLRKSTRVAAREALLNNKATVDLSTLDEDTYYPVTASIADGSWGEGYIHMVVSVQLNSGTAPSWSTHNAGFSTHVDIYDTPCGWGTIPAKGICIANNFGWCSSQPVGYRQMRNSSTAVFYLRGGGKYFIYSGHLMTWTIRTEDYTTSYETVGPTTSYPGISFHDGLADICVPMVEVSSNSSWKDIKVRDRNKLGRAFFYDVYNDDGPESYGNVIELVSTYENHWQPQIWLGGWTSGHIMYRNKAYADDTWGTWKTIWDSENLTNLNQLINGPGYITSSGSCASATIGNRPRGFASQEDTFSWGNQTGTAITVWNDSTGGSIGFRRDNPVNGQMSMIIDGTVYVDEGRYSVIHTGNIGSQSVNYATSAGSATTASAVAWSGITGKPIELGTNSSALNTNGWKTLGGRSSGSKIYISYATASPANWNSEPYSASIVFGCEDTKGLIDCGYNSPTVTFGGGSVGYSTDNDPKWYFKLSGTSGKIYTLPSDTATLLSTTGSIANCTGLTKSQVTTALGYTPPTSDTNTTYTFAGGTNKFTVTPSGGSAQSVTITPSITNNITGSGTSGYIAKFNGTNTITNGPAFGSDTTTYLKNNGTWANPLNLGEGTYIQYTESSDIHMVRPSDSTINSSGGHDVLPTAYAVREYLNSNFARYYKAGTTANTNGWKNGNNSVTITVTGVYLVIAWANFSGSSNMVQGINIHVGNYTYNQNIINMNYNQNITLSTTWIGSINANQSIYSQVYTGASQSNNTWIAAIRMS